MEKLGTLDTGALTEAAIQVGDDLFMVPTGLDEESCETFKPYSVNNPVKAAVHYRQADGGFGIARDPAVCRVDMTSIGPDEDGCERFQAVPRNADLPVENGVIYYRTTDGSFSPRKSEETCG